MAITKKFLTDNLRSLIDGQKPEGFTVILDRLVSHHRWTVSHELVFQYNEKYYSVGYSVAATEYNECCPFGYDQEIECTEVEPMEVLVTKYIPVQE